MRKYFFRHDLRFRYPGSRAELDDHLDSDVEARVDYIFSVGGDGTAHSIAQKLVNRETKLMVLPSGTANDFAHAMGTSGCIKKIADIFQAQQTRLVDVLSVNGEAMVTNGGLGIAADVAAEVNKKRAESALFKTFMRELGKDTYSLLLLRNLLIRPLPMRRVVVESPEWPLPTIDVRTPLILVNNQPKLANKFVIAPQTKNDDGTFNVTVLTHQDKLAFIKAVAYVLRHQCVPPGDENFVSFETNSLTLTPLDGEACFFGDGEQFATKASYEVKLLPRAIRVCAVNGEHTCGSSYDLGQIQQLQ